MQKSILNAALFFVLLCAGPAMAQLGDGAHEPLVQVSLVAENTGIAPGGTATLAIRQVIKPEWHTYWINPGDTGLATTMNWELPTGVTAGPLQFPTPERHVTGTLVNYGYSDNVMILADITAPSFANIGDTLRIMGKVRLLVCKDICVPETTDVKLELPIITSPGPGPWQSAFAAVRARIPAVHTAPQFASASNGQLILALDPMPFPADRVPEEAYFYPTDGLLIQHAAPQSMILNGRRLELRIPLNPARTEPLATITGDIWLRDANGALSYRVNVPVMTPVPATPVPPPSAVPVDAPSAPAKDVAKGITGFFVALFSAFIGGIILNLMPCVFPVLSLKALALVQKAHHGEERHIKIGGLVYLGGVVATFTVLGLILITLKAAGHSIGWGVQLQSPEFVAMLALLLFVIGLMLLGAITVGARIANVGQNLTQKSGHVGTFFTGALAVIVATPCTAPFMGVALFYALTQPAVITLVVLWALGFGLAFPYLVLTFFPNVFLKFIPRPGVWMEHFKQFLAFPMLATAVWLVWVLAQQTGAGGVLHVLLGALLVAFASWLWTTTQDGPATLWSAVKKIIIVFSVVVAVVLNMRQPASMPASHQPEANASYEAFSPQRLDELRMAGKPVFVNMTAAWCITCLANEKATLATQKVRDAFKEKGIVYLKGDWTNFDSAITQYLSSFGRSGVPLYVYYPEGVNSAPVTLPQILTPDLVLNTLTGENK
jgi:thiol:disulfide interchange protein/DsbC/DsbD-like thiol-disulfide interchange protein